MSMGSGNGSGDIASAKGNAVLLIQLCCVLCEVSLDELMIDEAIESEDT